MVVLEKLELGTTKVEVIRTALTNYILDDYGPVQNHAAEELLKEFTDEHISRV